MVDFFIASKAKRFFNDSVRILKKFDKKIRKRMTKGKEKEFYDSYWKGLGLATTTEPVLKYMIYTGLCHKYRMWSEYKYNNNTKLLDLGVRLRGKNDVHQAEHPDCKGGHKSGGVHSHPDTAIEMKIGRINGDKYMSESAVETFAHDLLKMRENTIDMNLKDKHDITQFFMQFIFFDKKIPFQKLEDDVNRRLKEHVKDPNVNLFYAKSFTTINNKNSKSKFWVLCWEV